MTTPTLQFTSLSACPVCRQSAAQFLYNISGSKVYECKQCGLRYLNPCLAPETMQQTYESNDSLTAQHDFHDGYYDYGDLHKASKTLRDFQQALMLLEKKLPAMPRSILDVGFGNGFFLAAARERKWEIHGIDSSVRNVELARRKFSLELTCSTLDKFNPNRCYDVISFWDVIEHLTNPHDILNSASRLLRPHGYILIGIPNDRSFMRYVADFLFWLSGGIFKKGVSALYFLEHAAYYNPNTLSVLLAANGFVRVDGFATSTDLEKYSFSRIDRILAAMLLWMGRLAGLENRFVAIYQKRG